MYIFLGIVLGVALILLAEIYANGAAVYEMSKPKKPFKFPEFKNLVPPPKMKPPRDVSFEQEIENLKSIIKESLEIINNFDEVMVSELVGCPICKGQEEHEADCKLWNYIRKADRVL